MGPDNKQLETEDILEIISKRLFIGYKEIVDERFKIKASKQIKIWQYFQKRLNDIVTDLDVYKNFEGKEYFKEMKERYANDVPKYREKLCEKIRNYTLAINKKLLEKKAPQNLDTKPLAYYAYISKNTNEFKLVTEKNDIKEAIIRDMGYKRNAKINEKRIELLKEFGLRDDEIDRILIEIGIKEQSPESMKDAGNKSDKKNIDFKEETQQQSYEIVEKKDEQSYYESIKRLYKNEFEQFKYWIDQRVVDYDQLDYENLHEAETKRLLYNINECINGARDIFIVGASGFGKTFSSLIIFDIYSKIFAIKDSQNKYGCPLFIRLSDDRIQKYTLKDIIKYELDNYNISNHKLIVILDGLNRVGSITKQKKFIIEVKNYLISNPSTRVIITSQTISQSFADIHNNFKFFCIQPFDKTEILNYIEKFDNKFKTKKEVFDFFYDMIERIGDLIIIPKILNILISKYERDIGLRIDKPVELFHEFENFLYGDRDDRVAMDEEIRKEFIPFLAFNMCNNQQSKISEVQLKEYINHFNNDPFLNRKEIKHSLIEKFDLLLWTEDDKYEFYHDIILAYFAAIYMKKKDFTVDKIFDFAYPNSEENNFILGALRLYIGMIKKDKAIQIIDKFITKDVFMAINLVSSASIDYYNKEIKSFKFKMSKLNKI